MSDLKDQIIDTRSLRLAANYIDCIRMILNDVYDVIPAEVKAKYQIQKLEDGRIDIQFPS